MLQFVEGAWPDDGNLLERLGYDVCQCDVDGVDAHLVCQLLRSISPLEVCVRIPDTDQLFVFQLRAAGAIGEEPAALAGPRIDIFPA